MKKTLLRALVSLSLVLVTVLALASCEMLPESITSLIGGKKECTHEEVEWVIDTPANCKIAGVKHSQCKACGVVIESNVKIDKNDEHTLGEWEDTITATCASTGSKAQKCTVCKKTVNTEEVPKLTTHTYSYGKCTVCRAEQPESAGLVYESLGNGTCAVIGLGTYTDASLVIPETSPAGDTVVSIGAEAFKGAAITSVIIPGTVTTAGNDAFLNCPIKYATVPAPIVASVKCNSITEITVNGSGRIPANAMQGATSLRVIKMLEGVTEVGDNAFSGTPVASIVMPDSLVTIGKGAFANSLSLKALTIGSGVVEIRDSAFQNCDFLNEVIIPESVLRIGTEAFRQSPRITKAVFAVTEGWKAGGISIDAETMADTNLAAKKLMAGVALSRG